MKNKRFGIIFALCILIVSLFTFSLSVAAETSENENTAQISVAAFEAAAETTAPDDNTSGDSELISESEAETQAAGAESNDILLVADNDATNAETGVSMEFIPMIIALVVLIAVVVMTIVMKKKKK